MATMPIVRGYRSLLVHILHASTMVISDLSDFEQKTQRSIVGLAVKRIAGLAKMMQSVRTYIVYGYHLTC